MPIEGEAGDFLVLNYRDKDFLISRKQFSASASIEEVTSLRSRNPYFCQYTDYNEEKMLLCDLNRFLMDKYETREDSESQVCLIIRLEDTFPPYEKILRKVLGQNKRFSQEVIGIIISSQAEIQQLPLEEMNLNPPGVDSLLQDHALLGSRFVEEGKIQFFIHLQKCLINILRGKSL
ncbi:MAG: hypothetical protein PQJ59_03675 [Spirochaetales bacterium]|nr:hypothetical protein [Spirochaetales bacterium]